MYASSAVSTPSQAQQTNTYTFIKEENRWFIHLPDFVRKGYDRMNELVEGAQSMLNTIAQGMNSVTLILDTEPFEGAERMELLELCAAPRGGGYYLMNTCNGRRINKKMWLCDPMLVIFGDMPEGIYFRKIGE